MHQTTPPARFRGFVDKHALYSHSDESQSSKYVPQSVLESCWTRGEISNTLELVGSQTETFVDTIRDQYLKVFSTLVFSLNTRKDYKKYIEILIKSKLDDSHLPFTTYPDGFPRDRLANLAFESIRRNQWIFCPMAFRYGAFGETLTNEMVLPFLEKEPLHVRSSAASMCSRVRIHPECQHLQPSDPTQDAQFFLKTYDRKHYDYYAQELAAYKELQLTHCGTDEVETRSMATRRCHHSCHAAPCQGHDGTTQRTTECDASLSSLNKGNGRRCELTVSENSCRPGARVDVRV